ncbi:MAG: hypothetical protein IJG13_05970 [Kiritimatiellae bacterium]|nr:hypothetical protein [Kiritimatiellia bacterium]MBQ3343940.1 hypothetical protein [Kiritimatiellia bacterium]
MSQIDQLGASEKMRLMEYLVKSISAIVERQSVDSKDPREEYFGCPRPDYSKLVGYGAKFHTPRSTEEWMKELREGEEG